VTGSSTGGMTTAERVVLAVDPHKASWTAAVVDHGHRVRGQLRVPASREGYRQLRRLARRWPTASLSWAVEGAHGLGLPLVERLTADGIPVVDVPAKLSARVRLLATVPGRKAPSMSSCGGAGCLLGEPLGGCVLDRVVGHLVDPAAPDHPDPGASKDAGGVGWSWPRAMASA
jgi:transposase